MFNSMGAVVIPDAGTVFFGPYRHNTDSGMLEAEKGVLRRRRLDVYPEAGVGDSRRAATRRLRSAPAAAVRCVHNVLRSIVCRESN